ncbi:MAG: HNH endonuclease [Aggregatilineales bacterium]
MAQSGIEQLFDRYAKNWEVVKQLPNLGASPTPPNSVFCPICFEVFDRSMLSHLSLEHVPPKSLGGKVRTITCTRCNNQAGTNLESHLTNFVNFTGFLQGVPGSESEATYTINDSSVPLAATVRRRDAQNWQLIGDPKRTKPGEIGKAEESLKNPPENIHFTLKFAPYKPHRPEAALLRVAYLWTFSVFGYNFLLDRNLEIVRRQINSPDAMVLPADWVITADFPDELIGINMIIEPEFLRSFLVVIDLVNELGAKVRRGVALPAPITPGADLYNALKEHREIPPTISLKSMRDDFDFLNIPFLLCDFWRGVKSGTFK